MNKNTQNEIVDYLLKNKDLVVYTTKDGAYKITITNVVPISYGLNPQTLGIRIRYNIPLDSNKYSGNLALINKKNQHKPRAYKLFYDKIWKIILESFQALDPDLWGAKDIAKITPENNNNINILDGIKNKTVALKNWFNNNYNSLQPYDYHIECSIGLRLIDLDDQTETKFEKDFREHLDKFDLLLGDLRRIAVIKDLDTGLQTRYKIVGAAYHKNEWMIALQEVDHNDVLIPTAPRKVVTKEGFWLKLVNIE